MNRITIRCLIFFAVLSATTLTASKLRANQRPNILFVLTDDQSPLTLDAYGDTRCDTPNIDSLAREGMVLTDAHHMGSWSGAVCLPSRTMIMTGRTVWHLPDRHGKNKNPEGNRELAKHSMPALFNKAGYVTFRTCKTGNTFAAANELFHIGHEQDCRGGDQPGSQWHAEHAMRFLEQREASADETPFLMFLGFSHPHDPRNGEPALLKKYGAINTQQPPKQVLPSAPKLPVNYLPAHPFPLGQHKLRDEVNVPGVLRSRSEATVRNEVGREFACIENIDNHLGRVFDKLKSLGEWDNTYVFFTSDHGISVGRHGLMGKQNLYEHTWKVPMLVRGPGIEPASSASGYTYLLDLLPTMCDLAGIAIPESLEGASFRPVLEGQQHRIRDVLYGCYAAESKPGMRAVKSDGWKLIKYDVLGGDVRRTQLFDLRKNPDELLVEHQLDSTAELIGQRPDPHQVNLAENPEHAAKRRELEALLLAEQQRLDDPHRLWDQPPLSPE